MKNTFVTKEKIEEIIVDRAREYLEELGIKASEAFEYMKKRVKNYKKIIS